MSNCPNCGEEEIDIQHCQHPGCDTVGCNACDEIAWYCDPDDTANGDYFCEKHGDVSDE